MHDLNPKISLRLAFLLVVGIQWLSSCLPSQATAQCDENSCDSLSGPSIEEAPSYGETWCERSELFGDWCGLRPCLVDKGYTWDISNTNFYSGITSGGLDETFRYRGRFDMLLSIDGKKAGLWEGLFINLHAESVFGDSINQFTGTLLPVSLAQSLPDGNRSVTALTNVSVTQALSESVLVYAGKINTLDGLNQAFTGGARGTDGFQNLGLSFNPVLGRAFPYSTFGAGIVVLDKNKEAIFTASVYDTNSTPTVSGFDTFFDNGVSLFASGTLPTQIRNKPGHQTVYGLYSTGTYNNLAPNPYFDPSQGLVLATPDKTGSWRSGTHLTKHSMFHPMIQHIPGVSSEMPESQTTIRIQFIGLRTSAWVVRIHLAIVRRTPLESVTSTLESANHSNNSHRYCYHSKTKAVWRRFTTLV